MHAIPNIDETQAFMKTSTDDDQDKHKTAFREKVFTEDESAADERHEAVLEQPAEENDNQQTDEFDLSDISAKAQSREEIIAAAEKEAFKE